MKTEKSVPSELLATATADIVCAFAGNNAIQREELPVLVKAVYKALTDISTLPDTEETVQFTPAVNPKRSVFPDYIICLEDGRKFKSLKRHLTTKYNMTPAEYREKWGLGASYPMVAPNYARTRAELAKSIGLGRKKNEQNATTVKKARGPSRKK